mmetsp:Transcript_28668/g.63195  ORF Transcript_28668/g.63195 Transcript_28668/m.63195 type:complete len:247 (+) Transcript_28668:307-1047(+)
MARRGRSPPKSWSCSKCPKLPTLGLREATRFGVPTVPVPSPLDGASNAGVSSSSLIKEGTFVVALLAPASCLAVLRRSASNFFRYTSWRVFNWSTCPSSIRHSEYSLWSVAATSRERGALNLASCQFRSSGSAPASACISGSPSHSSSTTFTTCSPFSAASQSGGPVIPSTRTTARSSRLCPGTRSITGRPTRISSICIGVSKAFQKVALKGKLSSRLVTGISELLSPVTTPVVATPAASTVSNTT